MKKEFQIIEELTPAQKSELDKDIQELYLNVENQPGFHSAKRNESNININLLGQVFLNLTVEFKPSLTGTVNGKIVKIYKYPNKEAYNDAINNPET